MKMNKSCKKLVNPLCLDLLISLSDKDIANCSYLLSCKYFNADKYVSKLFIVLVKQIVTQKKEYTSELRIFIYKQVFETISSNNELKKEEDNKLRVKYSDLTKAILKCLSIEALSKNKSVEDDLIFKELLYRKQYKLLQRRANSSRKSLLNTVHRSSDFHKNFFVIEENVQMMNRFMGKPFQKDKLEDINKHLDISYIIDKLKTHITLLTEQSSSINLYDYSSMEAIKDLLNLAPYKNHISIKLYSYAMALAKEPTETGF